MIGRIPLPRFQFLVIANATGTGIRVDDDGTEELAGSADKEELS
jgi:hypothetical protein